MEESSSTTATLGAIQDTFRILLVEDEPMAAKVVQLVLRKGLRDRFSCDVARSLAESFEFAQKGAYDIVLLDLNLPDSRADETLPRFLARAPDLPVIVLTGDDSEELGLRLVQAGAQDYLVKGDYNDRMLTRSLRYSRERHRMASALRRLAVIDELTGLYNRRGFQSLVSRQFEALKEGVEGEAVLLFFDLDDFKAINDQHGHEVGDEALRAFSEVLRHTFRREEILARFGGDEFVVFAPGSGEGDLPALTEAFERELALLNQRPDLVFTLKTSCGRFVIDGQCRDLEQALNEADRLLYSDKEDRKRRNLRTGR